MADMNDGENIERHEIEFTEFLERKIEGFDFNLKTVSTVANGQNCYLVIQSDHQIYDLFDETAILQTILDSAFDSFATRQYFTDPDGFDFGCATVWENPSMAISGANHSHQVKMLIVLEALEGGHNYDYHIVVLIQNCLQTQDDNYIFIVQHFNDYFYILEMIRFTHTVAEKMIDIGVKIYQRDHEPISPVETKQLGKLIADWFIAVSS